MTPLVPPPCVGRAVLRWGGLPQSCPQGGGGTPRAITGMGSRSLIPHFTQIPSLLEHVFLRNTSTSRIRAPGPFAPTFCKGRRDPHTPRTPTPKDVGLPKTVKGENLGLLWPILSYFSALVETFVSQKNLSMGTKPEREPGDGYWQKDSLDDERKAMQYPQTIPYEATKPWNYGFSVIHVSI